MTSPLPVPPRHAVPVGPSLDALGDVEDNIVLRALRERREAQALEPPSCVAFWGDDDGRAALDEAPPLPPQAQRQLSAIDEHSVAQWNILLEESQSAFERGLSRTPTERLVASLGGIDQLNTEQMMAAYLLLCATTANGTRAALESLQAAQEDHIQASIERQRVMREQIQEDTGRLERLTGRLSPVLTLAKGVATIATAAVLCTTAPSGLALAGLGAALGAAGALLLRRDSLADDWGEAGSAAVHGALLGATLTGMAGAPLMAWWSSGGGPWLAAGAGAKYAAERQALSAWTLAAYLFRQLAMLGGEAGQFVLDRKALAVRNSQGRLRVQQVDADVVKQGRQASLDALTQLVSRRHAALNQAHQVLSKRHQAVVRIQAQMRH